MDSGDEKQEAEVDESKVTPMEVSLTDDKVEDVYETMHGRVLKRSEKLNSFEVSDGCTIQVMRRMRGGGKHKDKRSKAEKKQAASGKTPEQKFVEEVRSDKSPAVLECDKDATVTRQESMSDVNQETQERDDNKMIHFFGCRFPFFGRVSLSFFGRVSLSFLERGSSLSLLGRYLSFFLWRYLHHILLSSTLHSARTVPCMFSDVRVTCAFVVTLPTYSRLLKTRWKRYICHARTPD